MKVQQLLAHHGIANNPFADEDAQTDPVFKDHCIASTFHPSWDKVYGNPYEPATAIVLGEKGSGKTAMRLQIVRHLAQHNAEHPDRQIYVIQYDDFNPFLDGFAETLSARKRQADRVLAEWKLWDHIDAILSLGVTHLIDRLVAGRDTQGDGIHRLDPDAAGRLDRQQARDLLLLAACYDQSLGEPRSVRWNRLRRRLRFRTWTSAGAALLGAAVCLAVAGVIVAWRQWSWLATPWPYLGAAAGWIPWLVRTARRHARAWAVARQVRVATHDVRVLRQLLAHFSASDLVGQPLPDKQRSDDRYELLMKLQGLLRTLGFPGIIVLVDRVDEPHRINGSAPLMKALVWPLLDNKFLKHPGLGIKLLLPVELSLYLDREDREFYQRARLDKQNFIPSLEWSGEALYDVAAARVQACAAPGKSPALRDLLDPSISDQRLIEALRSLRVPRHLFQFFYQLFMAHCSAHTDEQPAFHISRETFEATLAVYLRDQDAVSRGLRAG